MQFSMGSLLQWLLDLSLGDPNSYCGFLLDVDVDWDIGKMSVIMFSWSTGDDVIAPVMNIRMFASLWTFLVLQDFADYVHHVIAA